MGLGGAKRPRVNLHQEAGGSSNLSDDSLRDASPTGDTPILTRTQSQLLSQITTREDHTYKLYKRRFFGLAQLILLNIVVSWDWIAFAPVSTTAATYFNTTESVINWVSTVFLFAFCVATPFTFWALNTRGPKFSIIVAACLLLVGSWVKYGGTRANNFGPVMLGQLLIGFAQPFVLAAPATYSNLWFNASGRTTATAVASLANPFGAALGQLISPFWASKPSDIPNMILYISIISSVACIPAFFIPARPPTPPTAANASVPNESISAILADLKKLVTSLEFLLIYSSFSIYVGFFNAFSSLLNQILEPYGFTETEAGLAGAVLIVVGLVSAAISSPLIDKYKFYLIYIKIAVPVIALSYLVFIWAPPSRSVPYAFLICGVLGAASFGLVPVALEFLVEIHYPLGPELASTACWSGGQLLGGIFILIMDALRKGSGGDPPYNMQKALYFQAVVALAVMPLPLCLGLFGRKGHVRRKRWESERSGMEGREEVVSVEGGERGQARI